MHSRRRLVAAGLGGAWWTWRTGWSTQRHRRQYQAKVCLRLSSEATVVAVMGVTTFLRSLLW